jgi:hypothetical protein
MPTESEIRIVENFLKEFKELTKTEQEKIIAELKIKQLQKLKLEVMAQNPSILAVPMPRVGISSRGVGSGTTFNGNERWQDEYSYAYECTKPYVLKKSKIQCEILGEE